MDSVSEAIINAAVRDAARATRRTVVTVYLPDGGSVTICADGDGEATVQVNT